MFWGGVAFVVLPVVGGKFLRQVVHKGIAIGLGQNGGGSDGEICGITLYNAAVGNAPLVVETVAIHKYELGLYGESPDSQVHAVDGGAQNVHLVNVRFRHFRNGVCQSITFNDLPEHIPFLLCKLFGIIDVLIGVTVREDDGGGTYRSGKAATPYFITAAFHGRERGEMGF